MFHFLRDAGPFSSSLLLSFLLSVCLHYFHRAGLLFYVSTTPDSRFVFESTSCRRKKGEGEKERKKMSVYECRVLPVLMRRQLRQARGSCPRVQKIMPDRRSMCSYPCVRVFVTSHSAFAEIDRSFYLLLFSVSAVSGNFRSLRFFFIFFKVEIFGFLCINRSFSKEILGISG